MALRLAGDPGDRERKTGEVVGETTVNLTINLTTSAVVRSETMPLSYAAVLGVGSGSVQRNRFAIQMNEVRS